MVDLNIKGQVRASFILERDTNNPLMDTNSSGNLCYARTDSLSESEIISLLCITAFVFEEL